MIDFSQLIKNKRLEAGETQRAFAERFGVCRVTVSYWENGKVEAPYKVIDYALTDREGKNFGAIDDSVKMFLAFLSRKGITVSIGLYLEFMESIKLKGKNE